MALPIILAENAGQIRIENYGKNVADGVEANPTDFPSPVPTPAAVRTAITDYINSIKPERDRSIATEEITEGLRMAAIKIVNQLIIFAYYKVDGDVQKLREANIEMPRPRTTQEITKLEVKTSRMGTEPGSYFFRLLSKAGAKVIGVFRKGADDEFHLVDSFDVQFFNLKDQPSGDQTYIFKGKKGNNDWDSNSTSNAITVRIP